MTIINLKWFNIKRPNCVFCKLQAFSAKIQNRIVANSKLIAQIVSGTLQIVIGIRMSLRNLLTFADSTYICGINLQLWNPEQLAIIACCGILNKTNKPTNFTTKLFFIAPFQFKIGDLPKPVRPNLKVVMVLLCDRRRAQPNLGNSIPTRLKKNTSTISTQKTFAIRAT